ncbi:MAG: APC family permease [Oscillospiraceae bacterium]|nr:APC family permease [Oscillospiraceae bacterium]MBO5918414.1 APC family permease [Oscillospiraceae bacterium]
MEQKLERKYGLFTAICMVVGIVIGSGVFFKAQTILQKTGGDTTLGIIAWIIGGVIMLSCLLAFAFMGQKYERVNGIVDYAEAAIGPRYGYYMGWFAATIYFPGMTSALAWLSARYTMVFITSVNPDFPMAIPVEQGGCVVGPECMALTVLFMCGAYVLNALSPKLAGKFQTSTTVIKLIPLLLMGVIGIIYGLNHGMLQTNLTTSVIPAAELDSNPLFAAVCATAFAYEGWIIATSINSEIKDSKKNLPKALILGGLIIIAVYILYFVGVAGGAGAKDLMDTGANVAFNNVFGPVLGNILNLFVAISCMGTLNGLMLGCCRCMYSLGARGRGPRPEMFAQVDKTTNMPNNSAVIALLVTAVWFVYFYLTNLAQIWGPDAPFVFDSTELPIITIYLMYIPIFIQWMRKEKDQSVVRRFVVPTLALLGSAFMVLACIIGHGMACFWYLIVFAVVMVAGGLLNRANK